MRASWSVAVLFAFMQAASPGPAAGQADEPVARPTGDGDSAVAGRSMRSIPEGSFVMGSRDPEARSNETPHTVTVSTFAIMVHEVTVAEFKQFIDATGYRTDADRRTGGYGSYCRIGRAGRVQVDGANWTCDISGEPRPASEYDHPVIHVSWNDAVAYAEWLSRTTERIWRLPTEAEWEYAARGGEEYRFAGDDDIDAVGWHTGNAEGRTHAVGQKKPNAFGLYDMTGNVWEWCSDWFGEEYYRNSPSQDPAGPASGTGRVLRGGSWGHQARYCRITHRHNRGPDVRNYYNGIRLVLAPQPAG